MFYQKILDQAFIHSLKTNVEQHPYSAVFASAVVVLLAWRLVRFTIAPVFRPNEPKEYPYWIPGEVTQPPLVRLSKSNSFMIIRRWTSQKLH